MSVAALKFFEFPGHPTCAPVEGLLQVALRMSIYLEAALNRAVRRAAVVWRSTSGEARAIWSLTLVSSVIWAWSVFGGGAT